MVAKRRKRCLRGGGGNSGNVMKLSKDAKFQLISGISKSTSLDRVQTFVKTEFILKPDSFLIANNHAVHGHINWVSSLREIKSLSSETLRRSKVEEIETFRTIPVFGGTAREVFLSSVLWSA